MSDSPLSEACARCFASLTAEDIDRFWSKVNRQDGCWLWLATKSQSRYGRFAVGSVKLAAHRVSLGLALGQWPDGLVCHHCDNPTCVNPAHLYVGTNKTNVADMMARGRHGKWHGRRKGEGNPRAKLTAADVLEIRAARKAGERLRLLAARYGVSKTTIIYATSGVTWPHVSREAGSP